MLLKKFSAKAKCTLTGSCFHDGTVKTVLQHCNTIVYAWSKDKMDFCSQPLDADMMSFGVIA